MAVCNAPIARPRTKPLDSSPISPLCRYAHSTRREESSALIIIFTIWLLVAFTLAVIITLNPVVLNLGGKNNNDKVDVNQKQQDNDAENVNAKCCNLEARKLMLPGWSIVNDVQSKEDNLKQQTNPPCDNMGNCRIVIRIELRQQNKGVYKKQGYIGDLVTQIRQSVAGNKLWGMT